MADGESYVSRKAMYTLVLAGFTGRCLVVPVLRDVDQSQWVQMLKEQTRLIKKALVSQLSLLDIKVVVSY